MRTVTLNRLKEIVLRRHFPFIGDVSSILHYDPKEQDKSFAQIVIDTLGEYEDYAPLSLSTEIDVINDLYVFESNFDVYLLSDTYEPFIRLVPESILFLALDTAHKVTANMWRYRKPELSVVSGHWIVKYFTRYPYLIEYAEDSKFTENSRIFYIDDRTMNFLRLLEYNVLVYLRNIKNSVDLPTAVQFFNYDTPISELKQDIEVDQQLSSSLYDSWRLR